MSARKAIELNIEGMDCANCALGITRKLTKSGNSGVNVNFATGEASLVLGENCTEQSVVSDIESLGYRVIRNEQERKKGFLASTEQKFWFSLAFTIPLFFSHMLFGHDFILNQPYVQLALCLPVFLLGGWHFGRSAFKSLGSGVPNMDVLIFTGSTAAFIYSVAGIFLYKGHEAHNYLFFETAATIITLVLLGNVIEQRSVKRTTTAIGELTKMQPEKAKRITTHDNHEHIQEVKTSEVRKGDLLLINTGDAIPVDGLVVSGEGTTDESMLSGESRPVDKTPGVPVTGGTLLSSGSLRIRAEKVGRETMLAQIIDMVKNAQQDKPAVQKLGDRVSAIFVPAVLGISIITFLLSFFAFHLGMQEALIHSIAVLVISCPCAMGLATPTAVMVGIGRAARRGILIKGGSTLEELARIRYVVFDKTGTLTTGKFSIERITCLNGSSEAETKSILLALEQQSSHPIAKSVTAALTAQGVKATSTFTHFHEEKGKGLVATDSEGNTWLAGSFRVAEAHTGDRTHDVYLLKNNQLVATIDLRDELKPHAAETIAWLHAQGIETVLLSGDSREKCEAVAKAVGIQKIFAEQLPAQKLDVIGALMKEGKVAMVGDGVNDAPALAKADVGISLGDATQAALRTAQVVLLDGRDLAKLKEAWLIGRHSLLTIRQNLFWAFFYNVIAIPVAGMGLLSPMIAALSMAFSDVVVVGNSIRLRTKKLS